MENYYRGSKEQITVQNDSIALDVHLGPPRATQPAAAAAAMCACGGQPVRRPTSCTSPDTASAWPGPSSTPAICAGGARRWLVGGLLAFREIRMPVVQRRGQAARQERAVAGSTFAVSFAEARRGGDSKWPPAAELANPVLAALLKRHMPPVLRVLRLLRVLTGLPSLPILSSPFHVCGAPPTGCVRSHTLWQFVVELAKQATSWIKDPRNPYCISKRGFHIRISRRDFQSNIFHRDFQSDISHRDFQSDTFNRDLQSKIA